MRLIMSYTVVVLLILLLLVVGGAKYLSLSLSSVSSSSSIWLTGTHDEIFHHLACEENLGQKEKVVIYDSNAWSTLYQTYYDASQKKMEEGEEEWDDEGFLVEHEIRVNQYDVAYTLRNTYPRGR